jgi:hypothetical protein
MVQILPPADWKTDAIPVASAAVLMAADIQQPDFAHIPPPSDEVADMFEAAAAAAATPQAATMPPEVASETAASAATPTRAASKYVLWSAVGVAVFVVGGLALVMWPNGDEPIKAPATPVATAAVAAASLSEETLEPSARATDEVIEPTGQPYAVSKPPSDDGESVAPGNKPPVANPPAVEVAHSNESYNETSEPAAPPVGETEVPATSTVAASSEQQVAPVLRFDPLDFDPSQFSLGATASSTSDSPAASVNDEPPDGTESAGALGAADADDSDMLAARPANPSISIRVGPLTEESMRHNVAEQLAFEVDSLEVTDMPLVRFIDTLNDLSGAPITLDPLAFELSGSSPQGAVTISARTLTLEKLLRDALRAHRLEFAERNGHVVVELAGGQRRSAREFDVSDLMPTGAADASGVARLIEVFVSPQSWRPLGTRQDRMPGARNGAGTIEVKGGKLRVEQTKAVHHEMLLFCERLRLARGVSLKSRYPAELLSVDSPYDKLKARLAEKATFTFLPWKRLADVLQHWQYESGVTILADWHHIADVELGPATPVACSAIGRTWVEVLDEILQPLELGWWAADGQTIQITSREALDAIHRVEFYEIPKPIQDQFANGEAMLESVRTELSKEIGDQAAAADQLQMQLDKPSRRLIVRGTPQAHRYLSERLHSAK